MRCPYCLAPKTRVLDKRNVPDAESIRRRRRCVSCGRRFTTYERPALEALRVVKKDGRIEQFSPEKLLAGLQKACEKRPVGRDVIERTIDEIQAELRRLDGAAVPTRVVGGMVSRKLRALDQIAYMRFVSVYREFRSLRSFESEIRQLRKTVKRAANSAP